MVVPGLTVGPDFVIDRSALVEIVAVEVALLFVRTGSGDVLETLAVLLTEPVAFDGTV